jgi:hypothetical protein
MDPRVDPSESWQSGSRPRSYELRIHNVTVAELAASREMYDSQCLNFEDGKIVITRGRLAVLIYSYCEATTMISNDIKVMHDLVSKSDSSSDDDMPTVPTMVASTSSSDDSGLSLGCLGV